MSDTNKSVSLKRRLDEISQNNSEFSISIAQQEFENSNIRLVNPLRINDEVVYQKDIFSKLKFIYLEQETRDKFLRKISELTVDSIDKNDIKNIEQESMERKATFKKLKGELYGEVDRVEQLTNEVVSLYQELETKLQLTDKVIDEISGLEKEIDAIIGEEAASDDHNQLMKCMLETESREKNNFDELLAKNEQELSVQYTYLNKLVEESNEKRKLDQSQRQLIENLETKISELNLVLAGFFKSVDTDQGDEIQIFGKWCKEMNEIILKFTDLQDIQLKLDHKNDFQLSVISHGPTVSLVFNKNFEVLKVDGASQELVTLFDKLPISEEIFIQKVVKFITSSLKTPSI